MASERSERLYSMTALLTPWLQFPYRAWSIILAKHSDYRATLSLITFEPKLIVAIDPKWSFQTSSRLACWGICSAALSLSPKWIDLTWNHRLGSIGGTPGLLTHAGICCLTLEEGWPLTALPAVFKRQKHCVSSRVFGQRAFAAVRDLMDLS